MTDKHRVNFEPISCMNCNQREFEVTLFTRTTTILECCNCFKQMEFGAMMPTEAIQSTKEKE